MALVYGAYNVAAAMTYSSAREAHIGRRCSDAVGRYRLVASFFGFSLTTSRGEAVRAQAECEAVVEAKREQGAGDHQAAAESYMAALAANPDSPIRDTLERWRGEELLAEADEARDVAFSEKLPTTLNRAVELYARIQRELAHHSVAARARLAIDEIEGRLFMSARADPCSAVAYYDGLSSHAYAWIDEGLPIALYRCAHRLWALERYGQAKTMFSRVASEYPLSRFAPRARRGAIASEVAQIRGGKTGDLPGPTVSGRTGTGLVELSIRNSSPYPLELLLSGPDVKRLVVPACTGCREYPSGSEPAVCPPGPRRTTTISGGRYSAVVRSTTAHDVDEWAGDWSLTSGYTYGHCFYVVTSRG